MTLIGASVVILWLVTTVTVLAVIGLVRQNKVLEAQVRRLSGPSGGARSEPSHDDIRRLSMGARVLVAFYVDSRCPSCEQLLKTLPALAEEFRGTVRLAVVPRSGSLELAAIDVHVAPARSPLRSVDVPATPYAVAWTGDGTFRSGMPVGSMTALKEFLDNIREDVAA